MDLILVWFFSLCFLKIYSFLIADSSLFTKPSIFRISSSGTNTFNKINVSNCIGMNTGGIYKLEIGSLTDTNSIYDGIIAYEGGIYHLPSSLTVTANNVSFTNSFTYRGGMLYSTSDCTFSLTSGTVSNNRMYSDTLIFGGENSVFTLTSSTINNNTAAENTGLLCINGWTININGNTAITNNTSDGDYVVFSCFQW